MAFSLVCKFCTGKMECGIAGDSKKKKKITDQGGVGEGKNKGLKPQTTLRSREKRTRG